MATIGDKRPLAAFKRHFHEFFIVKKRHIAYWLKNWVFIE
jgi:hypothetical protein